MDDGDGTEHGGAGRTPAARPRRAGRSLRPAQDDTPPGGPRIDVGSRIGWLARTARQLRGGARLRRLEDMSRATGHAVTRLQRVETGQQRNSDVLDAYERHLDLPGGALVAPVDALCRTFPDEAPRDLGRGEEITDPARMSVLTEALLDPGPVTGGQWLAWAGAMTAVGGMGLPVPTARGLVERLVGELARSAASGYVSRYEALARLRCGPYGGLVLEVAQGWVADVHVQAASDVLSAVGEAITPAAQDWLLDLLEEERDRLVVGGALGLEQMAAVGGEAFWRGLLPDLVASFDRAEPGTTRWWWTSHLLRTVPRSTWEATELRPRRRFAPGPAVRDWPRSRTPTLWTECRARGGAVASRLGLDSGGLLARLVFDIAVSPHETQAVTGYMLLGALPEAAEEVAAELAEMAEQPRDPLLRARIARRLPGLLPAVLPDRVRAWIDSDDEHLRPAAMRAAGAAGVHLPVAVLEAELGGEEFPAGAMYAAGMSGHPVLRDWAAHPRPDVAGAAGWWLRQGDRVVR